MIWRTSSPGRVLSVSRGLAEAVVSMEAGSVGERAEERTEGILADEHRMVTTGNPEGKRPPAPAGFPMARFAARRDGRLHHLVRRFFPGKSCFDCVVPDGPTLPPPSIRPSYCPDNRAANRGLLCRR